MYAAHLGRDTVVNLLLDSIDIDANKPSGVDGSTALMKAVACGYESVVYFLMQVGVHVYYA